MCIEDTIRFSISLFVPFLKAELVPVGLRHGWKNIKHYKDRSMLNRNETNRPTFSPDDKLELIRI